MSEKRVVLVVALFVLSTIAGPAAAAASATTTDGPERIDGSTAYATADRTSVNLTYKVTQENHVGATVKLKSYTVPDGNNPSANWTIISPDGSTTMEYTSTSSIAFTPQQSGNYTVKITKGNTSTKTYDGETGTYYVERVQNSFQLSKNVSTVRPSDSVQFTVQDSGGGYVANASVTVGDRTKKTDADGHVTFTFPDNRTYNVSVDKPTTETTKWKELTTTVSVTYDYSQLQLSLNKSSPIRLGETVSFRVAGGGGSYLENATVHVGDETYQTNADGYAYATFTKADEGSYTVTASHEPSDGTWYTSVSKSLTVDEQGDEIDVSANLSKVRRGEPVRFHVSSGGSPLANATVNVSGQTLTTNQAGNVTTTLSTAGNVTATATKDGYEHATVTVHVGKDPLVDLTFDGAPTTSVNSTKRADLTLSHAPNGVAGYKIALTLDGSAASFDANATNYTAGLGLTQNVTVRNNGSTLVLEAGDTNQTLQAGAESVQLASVALTGESEGTVNVSVEVRAMDSDGGAKVDTRTGGATLHVESIPAIAGNRTPNDLDGDGDYEDVNGNGEVDYNDVVALFADKDSEAVESNAAAFDYNANGRVDYNDIVRLFEQAQASSAS